MINKMQKHINTYNYLLDTSITQKFFMSIKNTGFTRNQMSSIQDPIILYTLHVITMHACTAHLVMGHIIVAIRTH